MVSANYRYYGLFLVVIVIAVLLRLPCLDRRPMHTDEAVHAEKFGHLLEEGVYRYDKTEYHGPTLSYFTLVCARLTGCKTYIQTTEFTFRIVPVIFSIGLVLLPLLLVGGLGRPAVLFASLFTAVSPAFVFYSRYYIHETLLVFFTFAMICCIWRYLRSGGAVWAILAGLSAGLIHATKETCIIVFSSMLLAFLVLRLRFSKSNIPPEEQAAVRPGHIVLAVICALAVSMVFYSSFLTSPSGVFESIAAYSHYFSRADGLAAHNHPWYYYLDLLTWFGPAGKSVWNEDAVIVLAAAGFFMVILPRKEGASQNRLPFFIAVYTAAMLVIYCAIPYKTPWSMLGFLHGFILLAAIAAARLARAVSRRREKIALWSALAIFAVMSPAVQSFMQDFYFYSDSSNPYVYSHTGNDIFKITERINAAAQASTEGKHLYIQVICEDDDYWPLPWYLRSFERVGYWNQVPVDILPAPVIIVSPALENALTDRLYSLTKPGRSSLYLPLFDSRVQLRPGVELRAYITKELADAINTRQTPVSQDKKPEHK